MLRERQQPPPDIFSPEPWTFGAVRYDAQIAKKYAGQAETMFALANGYLGIRGTPEEGRPAQDPGVLLNGFYEHRPITYGELAYGFPRLGQSILNCPDGTVIKANVNRQNIRIVRLTMRLRGSQLDPKTGQPIRVSIASSFYTPNLVVPERPGKDAA